MQSGTISGVLIKDNKDGLVVFEPDVSKVSYPV